MLGCKGLSEISILTVRLPQMCWGPGKLQKWVADIERVVIYNILLWWRANAWHISFRISLQWPNYYVNSVVNTKLFWNTSTSGSDENANSSYNIHTLSSKQMVKILKLKKLSCCCKLTPNSHNQLTRKCVAAGRANEQSDLGSESVKRLTLFF